MRLRTLTVENKVLASAERPRPIRPPGPPWRILWPGVIRCRKSLEVLSALAERRPDLVDVDIRGRPSRHVFEDLGAELKGARAIHYSGPFDETELPALYCGAHFTWTVDWFDEGLNSAWLLPNRLYQAGWYGSVPIALRNVEIGRWLARRRIGLLLDDPVGQLEASLESLTPETYRALETAIAQAPGSNFASGAGDCSGLVGRLAEVAR